MKYVLKKYRGLLALGLMMALLTSVFTMDVGAQTVYYHTTSTYNSSSQVNENSKFYLKTEYHIGTQAPNDDAYIYLAAGGRYGMRRYQEYSFGATWSTLKQYSAESFYWWTNGRVENVSLGYEISGSDYGVGNGLAEVTKGQSGIDDISVAQLITIK